MISLKSLAEKFTYAIALCGIIPLFPWLTTVPRAVLVVGLLLGVWQAYTNNWHIRPWVQNGIIIPPFLYYALQFSRTNPVQPVISVLAIMLAVRLSGEKTVRHSLQIYALAMFCLASSSLFDLSPIFLLYLGSLLFLVAVALVLLTFQDQNPDITVSLADLKKILLTGILMPVLAVPLLLLFFPVMPRTQFPLWQFLQAPASRITGYSDSVEPGSQGSITASRTLVFRAETPRQIQSQPYWRGTVFNRTDGLKWTRITQIPSEQALFHGQKISQVLYPEPTAVRTIIALDRPEQTDLPHIKSFPDGVFELSGKPGKRISYRADSYSSGLTGQHNTINRTFYLQLPRRISPRITALADSIAGSGKDDQSKVQYLENYFRNGGYRYSVSNLATGDGALETFLFDKKQGHCEFFASSFALLLRAAGVPCRLVGGFLGGEYNQFGGYYLVTDDKAHVWVEAFIGGSGWTRIDPSSFAVNSGDVWKITESRSVKHRLTLMLDSINYLWNRSVITYDFEQQMNVARSVSSRIQGINPYRMLRNAAYIVITGIVLAGIIVILRQTPVFRSREQRILARFLHLVTHKFPLQAKPEAMGLLEIATAVDNQHVSTFVSIYAGAIYHDRKLTDKEYRRLRQILQNLRGEESKKS